MKIVSLEVIANDNSSAFAGNTTTEEDARAEWFAAYEANVRTLQENIAGCEDTFRQIQKEIDRLLVEDDRGDRVP
jgi:hypothetical protein